MVHDDAETFPSTGRLGAHLRGLCVSGGPPDTSCGGNLEISYSCHLVAWFGFCIYIAVSACLSVCLSVCESVCLSISLSICVSTRNHVYTVYTYLCAA